MSEIFELTMPTLSQMLRAETKIGQACSIETTLDAVLDMRGSAPSSDLILAGLRHVAVLRNDQILSEVAEQLDDIFGPIYPKTPSSEH